MFAELKQSTDDKRHREKNGEKSGQPRPPDIVPQELAEQYLYENGRMPSSPVSPGEHNAMRPPIAKNWPKTKRKNEETSL